MSPELSQLFRRYQQLQEDVGWSGADEQRLQRAYKVSAAKLQDVLNEYRKGLKQHLHRRGGAGTDAQDLDAIVAGADTWLLELFTGPYDAAYVHRRFQFGVQQVELGLDRYQINSGLSQLRVSLIPVIQECADNDSGQFAQLMESLIKLLDVDVTIIKSAYHVEQANLLRHTEARYQSLVESLPLHFFCKDLQGRVVFANQRYCDLLDIPMHKLIGMTDYDLFPRELADKYTSDDARILESGEPYEDVEENRGPDGQPIYVHVLKAPVADADGNCVGIQGVFWDVTDKKRAEQAARQSEDRFRQLAENIREVFWITSLNGAEMIYVSPAYAEIWGHPTEELYANPLQWLESIHDDDRARVEAAFQVRAQTGQYDEEYRILRPDGQMRWIRDRGFPVRDESGRPYRIAGVAENITKRRKAEEQLRHSDDRFRRLVESNIIGILITDFQKRILEANDLFLEMIGYSRAELEAGEIRWKRITPEEYFEADNRALAELSEKQVCTPWEKEYIRKDGSRIPVLVGVTALSEHWQEAISFIVDMTKQKQAEAELQVALDAADAANRAKGQFLANMSHEIRTPMNAIIGMTELVLDTTLSREQREYLSIVLESAEALLKLINDILDFSKIEAGRLEVEQTEFGLRDCVGGAIKALAVQAHQQGLELISDIAVDLPERVVGDQVRLRQILVNLVGNAIKFTGEGHVIVRVEPESATDDELRIHVAVSDTGEGIPADKLEHVFEAFEQLDSSMARKFGGTGLGLAISARLVQLLGGRIWCESELGEGTTFHFTARFEPLPLEQSSDQIAPSSLAGLRILVVDDNPANCRAIRETAQSWQLQPDVSDSAAAAMRIVEQAIDTGRPHDLYLIDAHMPQTDGFHLCEALMNNKSLTKPTIIMMLSPGDRSADVARCDHVGATAYLMKPLNQSELLDTMLAVLDQDGSQLQVAEEHPQLPFDVGPLNVLLVEDSPYNQKLALGHLKKQNHIVTVAQNGVEAVAAARDHKFDLILMDIQMPEMDGLEATRLIREHEQASGNHVPIIAMTAQAMKGDRDHCFAAGMDAYLAKPVRGRELVAAIASVMNSKSTAPPSAGAGLPNNNGLLDWDKALENVERDQELLREVTEAFVEECPGITETIESSLAAGNTADLGRAAHTLKGGMRMFAAAGPLELAESLESAAVAGDFEKVSSLYSELKPMVTTILAELSAFVSDPDSGGDD